MQIYGICILVAFYLAHACARDAMGNEPMDDPEMMKVNGELLSPAQLMSYKNNMALRRAVELQNSASKPNEHHIHRAKPYVSGQSNRKKRQSGTGPASVCLPVDNRYRNITGFCNNKEHEEWGSFFSATIRFFDPSYEDSTDSPRAFGTQGEILPGPRLVSLTVHDTTETPSDNKTHFLMQWGQYLAHDITLTPTAVESGGGILDCRSCANDRDWTGRCARDNPRRPRFCADLNCQPIQIPNNDPVYPRRGCMEFTRSLAAQLDGPREQLNELSVYLDASTVYGSDPQTAKVLRSDGGKMRVTKMGRPGKWQAFLPQLRDNTGCESKRNKKCFIAGDVRNTITPGLATMHILWLREHNRIAEELGKMNTRWNDDTIYQETRRIIGALHQKITYEEYLPKILGPEIMKEFNLNTAPNGGLGYNSDGFYTGYNPDCDATTTNVFSTAAFRFGHSLLDGDFKFFDGNVTRIVDLSKNWFNPDFMYARKGNIDRLFKGMANQKSLDVDRFYHENIRDRLFGDLDLAATNIQRGRDHGIQSWLKYRELFTSNDNEMPKNWFDLIKVVGMDVRTVASLYAAYKTKGESPSSVNNSIWDIDAYTGFLAEPHTPGGLVGITSARIIADQFIRLKDCDRFYFENANQGGSFTKAQLTEIRKTKLSHIICNQFDQNILQGLQEDIFTMPGSSNPVKPCPSYIRKAMDLTKWRV